MVDLVPFNSQKNCADEGFLDSGHIHNHVEERACEK